MKLYFAPRAAWGQIGRVTKRGGCVYRNPHPA